MDVSDLVDKKSVKMVLGTILGRAKYGKNRARGGREGTILGRAKIGQID